MSVVTNYKVNGTDLGSIFQPFTSTLTTVNNSLNTAGLAMSSDGVNIYTSAGYLSTTFFYSYDSGVTFTGKNINITVYNISTSSDGTYILISGIGDLNVEYAVSKNKGGSWTYFNTNSYNGLSYNGTAISSSGQYMFAIVFGVGLLFSNNYGVSWNTVTFNLNFSSIGVIFCSSNGKYVYFMCDSGIYSLTASGLEPYTINSYSLNYLQLHSTDFYLSGCNSNGNIVYVAGIAPSNYNKFYYSFNYGQSFLNSTILLPSSNYMINYISNMLVTDTTGQYLVISYIYVTSSLVFNGVNYYSNDYGKTWINLNNIYFDGLACNLNRSYINYISNSKLYKYTLPSIINTGYISNGTDISILFQPYTSGVYGPQTNYLTSTGVDLNTLFTVNTTFYNSYPTYTLTGTGTTQTLNGYTIVTFTVGTGSITFNKPVTNFGCICVAGGGGGSAGISRTTGKSSGNGGGGGGAYLYTTNPNITTASLTYNISVGNGGYGDTLTTVFGVNPYLSTGTNGSSSSVSINSNIIINCIGGKYNAGGGGNVTIPSGVIYNGGNGGNNTNGTSSTSYTTPFSIPSAITSVVKTSYGGGGGGAGGDTNGGTAGLNGLGGTQSGNTNTNRYGQNATSYGSGGGGGGNIGVLSSGGPFYYNGGDGAPGVVIFYFQ